MNTIENVEVIAPDFLMSSIATDKALRQAIEGEKMNNEDKLLLNEKEAAHLLSMSTHFLRRDRISSQSAGIPFVRIGAAVRYRRSDLEAWIVEQVEKTASRPQILERSPEMIVSDKRGRGRPKKAGSSVSSGR